MAIPHGRQIYKADVKEFVALKPITWQGEKIKPGERLMPGKNVDPRRIRQLLEFRTIRALNDQELIEKAMKILAEQKKDGNKTEEPKTPKPEARVPSAPAVEGEPKANVEGEQGDPAAESTTNDGKTPEPDATANTADGPPMPAAKTGEPKTPPVAKTGKPKKKKKRK